MSININLLPWRDARRERRTRRFYGLAMLALLLGVLVALAVAMIYQQELDEQKLRTAYIARHIETLEREIDDVKRYQTDAEQLAAQLALFTTLQEDRTDTVELFNALAASLTDGVVFEQLARTGHQVSVTAIADDERQVSEQLRRIARMPGLGVPVLSEVTSAPDQQGRLFRFEVTQAIGPENGEESVP
ncbi:PilN domain-containing protein [Halomonas sp. 707D7]|uniref:PilN domain-containing protein n=1 Tax=Halomonas sp. 707D7 TaxID=1681044 RepID=UPI00209DEAD9|nr:PilN domain-containing protein [Halomonas sp. 707D7]MCP1314850.1 PilN domain-containing protein [Halomonas sp. 707D7]